MTFPTAPLFTRLRRVTRESGLTSVGRWFLYAAAIGVVAGLGAAFFYVLSRLVLGFALGLGAGYLPLGPAGEPVLFESWFVDIPESLRLWVLIALPALGGLLAGFVVYRFAPEAEGHGTDAAIEAYHKKRGKIRYRIPFVKTVATALTIGSGGSGGREGPIAQIGAGFGSWLADRLHLTPRDRRVMLAAGMGAGIGAIFETPLAGALFAAEILYRDPEFESDVLIPAMLASIIGYVTFSGLLGSHTLFVVQPLGWAGGARFEYTFSSAAELWPYFVLAVVVGVGGYVWIRVFYGIRACFTKLRLPRMLKPALGGAITGAIAVGLYLAFSGSVHQRQTLSVLAFGYGIIQEALLSPIFDSSWIVLLVAVAVGKMLTTGCSIGSGGSAGVFGPSVVVGGCLGGAVGIFFHDAWPGLVPNPGTFMILGMAGFFAGAARIPVTTVVMVSELTGTYNLLLPSMWVCTLSYVLVRRGTLYQAQPKDRLHSLAHRGDFIIDVLEGITVGDVFAKHARHVEPIPEGRSLNQLMPLISGTHQRYFPVVDRDNRLTGIFSLNDIREVLYDHEFLGDLVTAKDVATSQVLALRLCDGLNEALMKFTGKNLDELPVISDGDERRVLGLLSRRAVLAEYTEKLHALKAGVDASDRDSARLPDIGPGRPPMRSGDRTPSA